MDAAKAASGSQSSQSQAANDNASGQGAQSQRQGGDAFATIRRKSEEKGRRRAEAEFQQKLKSLGVSSFEELDSKLSQSTQKKANKQAANDNGRRSNDQDDSGKGQWIDQKKRILARLGQEIKKRKEAEDARDKADVIKDLSIAAAYAGVRHIDFAIDMLNKQMKGKSEQELSGFDENKFFSGLKQTHPFLFHAEQQLATTAPTGSETTAPAAGSTVTVTQKAVDDKTIDARKLSQDEYQALLRKHGLTNPAAMM